MNCSFENDTFFKSLFLLDKFLLSEPSADGAINEINERTINPLGNYISYAVGFEYGGLC